LSHRTRRDLRGVMCAARSSGESLRRPSCI
jgi:hypothetical protein